MIRLHIHYPDDCPPSVLAFATAETATRVGEAMERLYPGAVAQVEEWCDGCAKWEPRARCHACDRAIACDKRIGWYEPLTCVRCVEEQNEDPEPFVSMQREAARRGVASES